jgi:hypothetical protein
MNRIAPCLLCLSLSPAFAAEDDKDINDYLVDITGGAVAATSIIGAGKSPITQIEVSQDLLLALQPFTSADSQKSGFGIAITPAKTTIFPMAGRTYVGSTYARLLGNLTLSYAQNQAEYASQTYRKSALSIDTVYYWNLTDDPVYIASDAYKTCADAEGPANAQRLVEVNERRRRGEFKSNEEFEAALKELDDKHAAVLLKCIDEALAAKQKVRWNSTRFSASYGEGRIKGATTGDSHSLGRSFNLNGQVRAGTKGVVNLSLRHAENALDPGTLGTSQLTFKSSKLAAVRFTYGDQDDSNLRALAEVSNSKSSSANAFKEAFMYAVGIDKKLMKGTWLEFRLGRNRSVVNDKEQTTALLSFSLSPTLLDFKK